MTKEQKDYISKIDTSFIKKSENLFENTFSNFGHLKMLGLLFITLKLTHVIDWNWCFVLLPYVLSIIWSIIAAYTIVVVFAVMAKMDVDKKEEKIKENEQPKIVPINE